MAKNGFTISAIRSLVNVAAKKHGVKVSLRVDGVKDDEEGAVGESAAEGVRGE